MSPSIRSSFLDKYLDPATSMGEILFGLIMTLTFTLGAGLTIQEEGRRRRPAAADRDDRLQHRLGRHRRCLLHAGAALRARTPTSRRATRSWCHDEGRRRRAALVAGELDDVIEKVMTPEERQRLYGRIVQQVRTGEIPPNPITRDDVMGGIASFWLVFFASLPAAIPFLFIDDARLRLARLERRAAGRLLFVAGLHWARYTTARPALTGLVFLLFGAALVAMAIALGG